MNILLTGGAGFIGSNFIHYILSAHGHTIVNLDSLTYAGHLENLEAVSDDPRYHFIEGDINDRVLLNKVFQRYEIDTVINFAAESHVDRSIENPSIFLETNVLGTHALLQTAKEHWQVDPLDKNCTEYKADVRFLQVSTDEVYGDLEDDGYFTENTGLAPNSPYSASKASADLIARAYYETFQLPVIITRCSNNYGPYQFPEKLIPLLIHRIRHGQSLPIYGDGMQVRDWLYVEDHCTALYTVLSKGKPGEVYNIGGNNEKTNMGMAKLLLELMGGDESLMEFVQDRLGHDRRYAIDNTKITEELGWSPAYTFEEGIKKTVRWYMEHEDWLDRMNSKEPAMQRL